MSERAGPLLSVEGFSEMPTIEAVAISLGVSQDQIDPDFGVVLVDPRVGAYCVMLKEDVPLNLPGNDNGPWANPTIGPLG